MIDVLDEVIRISPRNNDNNHNNNNNHHNNNHSYQNGDNDSCEESYDDDNNNNKKNTYDNDDVFHLNNDDSLDYLDIITDSHIDDNNDDASLSLRLSMIVIMTNTKHVSTLLLYFDTNTFIYFFQVLDEFLF